jgi:hypothetical protein
VWAIAKIVIMCLNAVVISCVLNQSKVHWLLFDALVTTINFIMAMEYQQDPLLMGVKYVISLMLSSIC